MTQHGLDVISIILPAYNVEKFIGKCIESLEKQSYPEIEILVVDDGSTDSTGQVVHEFQKQYNNIRYIYQNNQGAGPARNNGLSNATGKFVIFVDPDDWADRKMVENLVKAQSENNADLVCSGYTDVLYESGKEIRQIQRIPRARKLLTQQEARNGYVELLTSEVLAPPTRKLYKMEIIQKYDIRFPTLRRSQDIVFNYRYYNFVNSCVVLNESLYNYRIQGQREYIAKLKPDYYLTVEWIYNDMMKVLRSWQLDDIRNDVQTVTNYMENLLMLNIESNLLRGNTIDGLLSNDTAKMIILKSQPSKFFNYLMRYGAINCRVTMLKSLVRLRLILRIVKRRIWK